MRLATLSRIVTAALAAVLFAPAANAGFRAYLSSTGNDANPCTLVAPCRLLPAAHTAVDANGEIWMLDSANYNTGTVNITKSVSILAIPGAVGSLVALDTLAPAVTIGGAGLVVSFRNLVFVPFPGAMGGDGIQVHAASTVLVEYSVFANLQGVGISSQNGTVRVVNTIMRHITQGGIRAQDGSNVAVVNTQILECGAGVSALSNASPSVVTVSDSLISGANNGVWALSTGGGGSARAIVTRTTLEGNSTGLLASTPAGGTAVIQVSGSMINGGTWAWQVSGGGSSVVTLGNNHFANAIGSGTMTTGALQ
jgi:hypothetical protein